MRLAGRLQVFYNEAGIVCSPLFSVLPYPRVLIGGALCAHVYYLSDAMGSVSSGNDRRGCGIHRDAPPLAAWAA